MARLAWRELRASRVGRRSAAGAPASSNSARIRPVGAVGVESWQARLGATPADLVLGRPVPPAPAQTQMRIEFDRWVAARVESWQTQLGASSEGPGRSSAAGAPRKLKFGSHSTAGVLLGWNCGTLDLARAPGTSCLVVQCRRCSCKLRFAQIRLQFHRGVLLGTNCGALDLERAPVASWLRPNATGAPAISGLLEFGWSSTGGVLMGSNRGTLDLARAPVASCLAAQCRRCPCNLRLARIRLELDQWGVAGVELWHA